MTDEMRHFPLIDLRDVMLAAFAKTGMPQEDAAFLVQSIIASELSGHACHGVRRFPEYIERWLSGHADPLARMDIRKDTGPIIHVDGRHAFGHLFLRDATDLAVARARQHGICMVSGFGSEAAGRIADYCERAADAGVATLFFVNDSGGGQAVAPPGGLEARLSTNPIAFGVPRSQPPHLVLDMATSTVAAGRLGDERDRGNPIPPDWVNTAGVLRSFGGFKGFGLALVAEALAGALSGGGTVCEAPETADQSFLLIAIDIAQLRPLPDFTTEIDRFLEYVRSSKLEADAPSIRFPGEAALLHSEKVVAEGIGISPVVLNRLRETASKIGVNLPDAFL
jgi:uncharacterized oxidoreductase